LYPSLPVYIIKDHKYPVVESHSSYVLIPNLDALRGRYCLNDRQPFQSVSDSSIEMSLFGRYSSWNLLLRCKITGNILKSFAGPSKLLTVSMSAKSKNVYIISNLSHVIMSLNPGVEMTLLVVKYDLRVGCWIMPISINNPNTI
jgi:hypothetical protein